MMVDIVVGSGPSGISVTKALLDRGREVLLLDGGKTLENEHDQMRNTLAATDPANWSTSERAQYQSPQFSTPEGQARRFGSDFAMEPANTSLSTPKGDFALRSSYAAGGLSNLWGGAVLPYRQSDIVDWPVTISELKPHYKAVADFMPVSGSHDDLADLLPGFDMNGATPIAPGPQASNLLRRLAKIRAKNTSDGVHFGAARQAVDATCNGCGMCLHGCPWGYIYSSQRTLHSLLGHPKFTYRPGAMVKAFREDNDSATLTLSNGETIKGKRIFLAAGVLETARIVLASGAPERQLTLLDSQHAFVPMLHRWRTSGRPDTLPYTTLPQIFLEIDNADVSPHLVHSQLYTWNEYFARDLIQNYAFGLPPAKPILRMVANRLIVAQVFLHSDHSARIELGLAADGKLTASLNSNPSTPEILSAATKKLSRAMGRAGMITLGFAARPGPIGSSFHTGGTVPMANKPVSGQSDRLGRPYGLHRVHLVDASVFPSVPATTITFSAMANAHRIGTLAP